MAVNLTILRAFEARPTVARNAYFNAACDRAESATDSARADYAVALRDAMAFEMQALREAADMIERRLERTAPATAEGD